MDLLADPCSRGPAILGSDLEPLSFDDLPLGGEWTTRRRTVTEAEIALFAGIAGDLSPLVIEARHVKVNVNKNVKVNKKVT